MGWVQEVWGAAGTRLWGGAPSTPHMQQRPSPALPPVLLPVLLLLLLLQTRAEAELKKVLTDADAPACLRLLLNDAGTFDLATKTGGCDGSIVLP